MLHPQRFVSGLCLGIGLTFMLAAGGCRHAKSDSDPSSEVRRTVTDSLQAGNISWVDHYISDKDAQARQEKDSDLWSTLKVMRSVWSYYAGKDRDMVENADSAIAYLRTRADNPSRILDLSKAYQGKSLYWSQFKYVPDSADVYMRLALAQTSRNEEAYPVEHLLACSNYGDMMRLSGHLDSALVYYHRAVKMIEAVDMDPKYRISIYGGMGGVFTDLHDFQNSSIWWAKAKALAPRAMAHEKFATLNGIGNDFYYQGNYEESNKVFRDMAAWLDSIPTARWERMFCNMNLADSYLMLGRVEDAKAPLDSAEVFFSKEQENPTALSYLGTLRIREALLEGNFAKAEAMMANYPFSSSDRPEQQRARLRVMTDYYIARKNWKGAFEAQQQYEALEDSMRSDRLKQQLSSMQAIFDHDSKMLELKEENATSQSRIYRLWMIIGLSLAALLTLMIAWFFNRRRVAKREARMLSKITGLRRENLRSRITPHFIYNALNHEVAANNGMTAERLDALVRLLRHQQYIESEITIPLARELDFVADYITIEKENVAGPFEWRIEGRNEETGSLLVPSMFVQIMVENAFKHSFITQNPEALKFLVISVEKNESGLVVSIFNTGPLPEAKGKKSGSGLRVIMETMQIINEGKPKKMTFTLLPNTDSDGKKGCMARFHIPYCICANTPPGK